jgi:hypothetical protein
MANGNRRRGAQSGWTRRRTGLTDMGLTDRFADAQPDPQPEGAERGVVVELEVLPKDRRDPG